MVGHVVLLCGGSPHAHDFDDIGAALESVIRASGRALTMVDHPDALPERLATAGHDAVLVIHGLWWRMLDDVYTQWRADHAYESTPDLRRAVSAHVADGGGLLALHTAPVCFDDWPQWADIIGAGWVWGTSFHPPLAEVTFEVAESEITGGIDREFRLVDEVYGDLAMAPTGEVVVRARRDPDDALQPIVWTHRFGRGRVVTNLLGHDGASITDPAHRRLILNALDWIEG